MTDLTAKDLRTELAESHRQTVAALSVSVYEQQRANRAEATIARIRKAMSHQFMQGPSARIVVPLDLLEAALEGSI